MTSPTERVSVDREWREGRRPAYVVTYAPPGARRYQELRRFEYEPSPTYRGKDEGVAANLFAQGVRAGMELASRGRR